MMKPMLCQGSSKFEFLWYQVVYFQGKVSILLSDFCRGSCYSEYFSFFKMKAFKQTVQGRDVCDVSFVSYHEEWDLGNSRQLFICFQIREKTTSKLLSCSIFATRPCGEKKRKMYEPKFQSTKPCTNRVPNCSQKNISIGKSVRPIQSVQIPSQAIAVNNSFNTSRNGEICIRIQILCIKVRYINNTSSCCSKKTL